MVTQADALVEAQEALPAWLTTFEPHPWLTNGHLQTIVGNFLPRTYSLPEPESQLIEVEAPPPIAKRASSCATVIGNPSKSAAND